MFEVKARHLQGEIQYVFVSIHYTHFDGNIFLAMKKYLSYDESTYLEVNNEYYNKKQIKYILNISELCDLF